MAQASIVRTGLQKSGRGSKPPWTECSSLFVILNVSQSCGVSDLFSGVKVMFLASRKTWMANSAFPYSFRKTPKVISYTRRPQLLPSFSRESTRPAECTHTVIEAATGTGAAGGLDLFSHSCRNKHIKLDLCPRTHSDPWLIIYLPAFFLELRS